MGAPPGEDYVGFGPPPDEGELGFRDTIRDALIDSAGLDAIPEPEPLVDGVLNRDSLAWIQGKRSNAKSLVALDIAGCVGTGHHWQGRAVHQGKVLFIAAEGVSGMRRRVRAWEKSYGRSIDNVTFLPMPVQANLDQWGHLVELAHEEFAFDLIVIDTQARVTVGMEENAAKDMGVFVDKLEWLRRATGACILVIHHMGRNGEHMRGSTALEGAATTIVQVVKDDVEVTVSCEKQKDGEEFADIHLKLVPVGDSVVLIRRQGWSPGHRRVPHRRQVVGHVPRRPGVRVEADQGRDRTRAHPVPAHPRPHGPAPGRARRVQRSQVLPAAPRPQQHRRDAMTCHCLCHLPPHRGVAVAADMTARQWQAMAESGREHEHAGQSLALTAWQWQAVPA
jgi:AAA domain